MQTFTTDFAQNCRAADAVLRVDKSFDLSGRSVTLGGKSARLYVADGIIKEDVIVKTIGDLLLIKPEQMTDAPTVQAFAERFLPLTEVAIETDVALFCRGVLSGTPGLLVEGYDAAILLDIRAYPVRAVSEPENNRVLRGPHEGFVETLISNTAMLRRRLRDPALTMELRRIGTSARTDVALCWMEGKADKSMLAALRKKLDGITVDTLTMGQESLLECLMPRSFLNPFPKVRYTERPDAAAASLSEGSLLLLVDGSPAAMILPTGFFAFMQDTNDYYFSPFTGSFIRLVRLLIFSLTLLLVPTWFLLMRYPQWIPEGLHFIEIAKPNGVPIFFQLLMVELIVDALKLASINTPSSLGNSLSVISALVLGDFAVQAGWLVAEVVLYMAFVAVATFAQSSFEMGWAFKISRLFLIVMVQLFGLAGYCIGILLVFLRMLTTKTVTGRAYLDPLIPFRPKALARLLLRLPLRPKQVKRKR